MKGGKKVEYIRIKAIGFLTLVLYIFLPLFILGGRKWVALAIALALLFERLWSALVIFFLRSRVMALDYGLELAAMKITGAATREEAIRKMKEMSE